MATPDQKAVTELGAVEARKQSFLAGIDAFREYSGFIKGVSLCEAQCSDELTGYGPATGDKAMFGLFAHVRFKANQFMPLDKTWKKQLAGSLIPALSAMLAGKKALSTPQLETLWQAFQTGPALRLGLRLAKTKTDFLFSVFDEWPKSG